MVDFIQGNCQSRCEDRCNVALQWWRELRLNTEHNKAKWEFIAKDWGRGIQLHRKLIKRKCQG